VVGAHQYRSPDDDLPPDLPEKRAIHYQALRQPEDVEVFVSALQAMAQVLAMLEPGLPHNPKVKIVPRGAHRVVVSPLVPKPGPFHLTALKAEIMQRWTCTGASCMCDA